MANQPGAKLYEQGKQGYRLVQAGIGGPAPLCQQPAQRHVSAPRRPLWLFYKNVKKNRKTSAQ